MSFESDLVGIVKRQFDELGIRYDRSINACSLAARYFEMLRRRIAPTPRRVHFSKEIDHSLGNLPRNVDLEQQKKAEEAWRAVFEIRHLLKEGRNVNGFLHRGINHATGSMSYDGLLWDFGMHHFHLSKKPGKSGFFKRSGFLLFAIVDQEDVYFVDVRPHPKRSDPNDFGWVQQDLLKIVHSNWPELVAPNILRGVKGDVLTDKQKKELRRKNVNHLAEIDGQAIAPIGGGIAADGSSILCRFFANNLLRDLEQHQQYFDSDPMELRSGLAAKGITSTGRMEFELVLLADLNPPHELIDLLSEDQCLSKDLCNMGFAVVERNTRSPIVVALESNQTVPRNQELQCQC